MKVWEGPKKTVHVVKSTALEGQVPIHKQGKGKEWCTKCDFFHRGPMCPAFGKVCRRCNKKDHFETYCKTDRVREVKNIVEKRSEGSPDFDILEISGCNAGRGSEWLAPATVDGKEISRSHLKWTPEHNQTCSHLWLHCVKKNTVLKKSAAVLGSCNGSVISHKRKTTLMVLCKQGIVEFFVVKKSRTSILGPQTCANS